MLRSSLVAVLTALSSVSAKIYDTRFKGTTWDDENWIVTTTNLDQGHYQSRMSLANGYWGINVAAAGPFFEIDTPVAGDNINGWPLFDRRQTFATIAGFYDSQATTNSSNFYWLWQYGGESVISGVPHWSGLHVESGGEVLSASVPSNQISNFKSWVDIHHGTMYWTYTWTPKSGSAIDIEYSMLVHKLYLNQAAVQLKMTAEKDAKVSVIDVLNGDCAVRTEGSETYYSPNSSVIWSKVSPHWLPDIEAYVVSTIVGDNSTVLSSRKQYTDESVIGANSSSVAQAVDVQLKAGTPATISKYIGGASSDAFDDPATIATEACSSAAAMGFARLYRTHSAEWASIMTPDSVDIYTDPDTGLLPDDENVIELAITAVTNPFHLLQNTIGTNALALAKNDNPIDVNSIAVGGLGSASYAGWIFWDAEVWMAPGLVVAYPEAAKGIAAYRVAKYPAAQDNIATAYQSSKNDTSFSSNSAVFPWVSGRFGNCTAAGPCFDYEYHLNGDIGLEIYNYYVVTGDVDYFESSLFPIYDSVASLYADIVGYNSSTKLYDLYNGTDPDEYANFQNNIGFTMALISTHLDNANGLREQFGLEANATWTDISDNTNVPVDTAADIILEYQTMPGSVEVKQADVVLIDDFLDYPNPYSFSDLLFYAGRQSLFGPGMTFGVFSVVANAHSPSGCGAYTYELYGSQPYTRAPWFQYSEQLLDNYEANGGTHPAYPFLTGMGGAYRVPVFGYLGLHLMQDSLNVNPNLPPQIPYLEYRTIYWQGWPIKAVSDQTHTTLTRIEGSLDTANPRYVRRAIPVTIGIEGSSGSGNRSSYSLPPGGTISIPNRNIASVQTVPGNIAQCLPVTSPQAWEPGQFPLSAVDGLISTKWQPINANASSSMTVELTEPYLPITELSFDWAQNVPKSYKVTFSNSSAGSDSVTVASDSSVKISNPYVPSEADEIKPYMSNTTSVTLDTPVYSGLYATLTIQGNQAGVVSGGIGASVAEFAIVAGGASNATNVVRRHAQAWVS